MRIDKRVNSVLSCIVFVLHSYTWERHGVGKKAIYHDFGIYPGNLSEQSITSQVIDNLEHVFIVIFYHKSLGSKALGTK